MTEVLGAILAGGLSRRFGGGDKCLQPLGGRTILDHVIERARPQVGQLILNANGDPSRFEKFGLTTVPDVVEGYAGPLAGILSVMEWAREYTPQTRWVATFPGDAPFVPLDFVETLMARIDGDGAELACAASNGRTHPVCGMWNVKLADALRKSLIVEDLRKIDLWTAQYALSTVNFEIGAIDPFFNINRPEDLKSAERTLTLHL